MAGNIVFYIFYILQVQLGNTLARRYVGSSQSEEEAARLYDKKSIASNGLAAKTNFSYTKAEIEAILKDELGIVPTLDA